MATPVRLPWMTDTLASPTGLEDAVMPLPCHRDRQTVMSAWKLTDDELRHVQETGTVLLHVWGHTHPPVAVGILAPEKKSGEGA